MRRGMSLLGVLARAERALAALEVGDLELVEGILAGLIRDLDEHDVATGNVCPGCGLRFRWPGQLDHHLRFSVCGRLRCRSAVRRLA